MERHWLRFVWTDFGARGSRVRFVSLVRDGSRSGEERGVAPAGARWLAPQLAWSGREYGLTYEWIAEGAVGVGMTRLSRTGERLGNAGQRHAGGSL